MKTELRGCLEGSTENEERRGFAADLSKWYRAGAPSFGAGCSGIVRQLFPLLALPLAACGGGGSSAPEAPAAQPTKVCTSPVVVQMVGDSTQWAQGNNMQLALDVILGPGRVIVENLGESGATAADYPASKIKPGAIVVANYGINDSTQPGATVEAYKANLRKIAPALFETPSPPFDGYAQAMREVAAETGTPVIDVSAKVRTLPDWEQLVPDGKHPSGAYWLIARDMVAPVLAEAVKRATCLP